MVKASERNMGQVMFKKQKQDKGETDTNTSDTQRGARNKAKMKRPESPTPTQGLVLRNRRQPWIRALRALKDGVNPELHSNWLDLGAE